MIENQFPQYNLRINDTNLFWWLLMFFVSSFYRLNSGLADYHK
nr:MAG TPA: PsbL protein [Caudoviricetes sp.]